MNEISASRSKQTQRYQKIAITVSLISFGVKSIWQIHDIFAPKENEWKRTRGVFRENSLIIQLFRNPYDQSLNVLQMIINKENISN